MLPENLATRTASTRAPHPAVAEIERVHQSCLVPAIETKNGLLVRRAVVEAVSGHVGIDSGTTTTVVAVVDLLMERRRRLRLIRCRVSFTTTTAIRIRYRA